MADIVEARKNEVLADSRLVAKKFGMKHAMIVRVIDNTLADFPDIKGDLKTPLNSDGTPERYYTETRNYRGADFEVYLMNREFFSLVAMRLTTKKAREWTRTFNSAFYQMESRLLNADMNAKDSIWVEGRKTGKIARREETDVIKLFVDYATDQGSENAKHYYKHLTNATYKALGMMAGRYPKIRDEMSIYEMSELLLAERLASSRLQHYMEIGRDYKDIYQSVRKDLIDFGEAIRIPTTSNDLVKQD